MLLFKAKTAIFRRVILCFLNIDFINELFVGSVTETLIS